ncbi:hypothetical protein WR25_07794 [Diploscapter pachys]|uniref:G-protein coupled receptors family 1 profile domain-containing protein n=1 Tax=Diploscapter pachys TaxID=2018661 RepID=A0A2A2JPU5_9BILA|nr:hypothetical protein WR25_07794 [Diploscapter pachys]
MDVSAYFLANVTLPFQTQDEAANQNGYKNGTTPDLIRASCFTDRDTVACIRTSCIGVLSMLTAFLCLMRILKQHNKVNLRLLLYYILLLQCIAGSLEFYSGWRTELALSISYAKAIALLIICYMYLDIASRMMRWSSNSGRRLCFIALTLMFAYFTAFLIMGFLLSIEPNVDCRASYWIWYSSGEVLIVQLIVISFFLILRRINQISATQGMQTRQKRDLHINKVFRLLWTFETCAFADLAYHISLYIFTNEISGCSGLFANDQLRYTALKGPYDVVSILFPVWAVLFVFRFTKKQVYEDADIESNYCPKLAKEISTFNTVPSMPRRLSLSHSIVSSPLYSIPEELHNVGSSAPNGYSRLQDNYEN